MIRTSTPSILKGAFILSLAGLISKMISAGYRVPLQNLTGDLGFYVYQQVYPILGMALVLALYGFPGAISKLISDTHHISRPVSIPSFYLPVFALLLVFSLIVAVIGWLEAPQLARWMGDPRLVPSIRTSFFVFLFIPVISVLRGVFQGKNDMTPTAVSQIVEQILRVAVIIAAALIVSRGGDLYHIGAGAAYGSMAGALAAAVFLIIWTVKKPGLWSFDRFPCRTPFSRHVLLYGLLISFNYMLLLSLQLVDAFTLVPQLVQAGYSPEEAKVVKGIYDRGQPLIQLGTILASSLALALIPSVTRRRLEESPEQVRFSITGAGKITLYISTGAAAGLIFLFPDVNKVFFQDEAGSGYLRVLMLVIIGSSLSITTASVLQGLGRVRQTAFIVIGGIGVKAAANLLWIPAAGIYGASFASLTAVAFVLLGNIVILRKDLSLKKRHHTPGVSLVLAVAGMSAALYISRGMIKALFALDDRLPLLLYILALSAGGAVVFGLILIRTGGFTRQEIEVLPSSKRLIQLLPKG
ncbi:oligosaccharide flippase family protein [Halobacillus litoralis]|uniref:Oligosaccharide flippase family protein n=1 Tax=Halobacillus litoralis TaxID=45668 RepID=A0A845E8J7_9BACI|nr:polysaccharide biosynthesis protein [Halobacillus litoralis]MYL21974.1 oligosaccharide flippase family protein [Halobacillus litoralis]